MHLNGCHLCKCPYPRDAMTVCIKTKGPQPQFEGRMDVVVRAAIKQSENDEKLKKEIQFDKKTTQVDFAVAIQQLVRNNGTFNAVN